MGDKRFSFDWKEKNKEVSHKVVEEVGVFALRIPDALVDVGRRHFS